MQTWQMRFSAEGRPTLFPDESLRRDAVRTVGRICGGIVVLLSIVDDHLHLLLLCDRARVGRVAHDLLLALRPLAPPELEPPWLRPVSGRHHLESLVEYLLTQVPHHGLPQHPALYTGNGFVDLVGARAVDGLQLRLAEALPRYRQRAAYEAVGLPATPLAPAGATEIRAAGANRLAEAAKAALCVGPELRGRALPVVRARLAAVQLAREADLRSRDLVEPLGIGQRAVQMAARRSPREGDVQAVRLRLALEMAVGRAQGGAGAG